MKRIGIKYLIYIFALLIGEFLLDTITIDNYNMVLVFGLILLLVNMIIKPIALLITIPLNMITFGLFSLVVNAWMIQLAAVMIKSIHIEGFLSALLVAVIVVVGRESVSGHKKEGQIQVD
ncbi:MAG: phage holin family protein [Vallitaleaceae bacterium]|jgi:putative membrane protein|nr:phage holin family protein [Vallitaleaceae bacterium]